MTSSEPLNWLATSIYVLMFPQASLIASMASAWVWVGISQWFGLLNSQGGTTGFRNHRLMPGWIPDDLHDCIVNSGYGEDLLSGIAGDDFAHSAAGGRQSHFDTDFVFPGGEERFVEIVNQAEVDDVDGYLGIEAVCEFFPDGILFNGRFGLVVREGSWGGLTAQGIAILAIDPKQGAPGVDREGAAEFLGDVNLRSLG